MKFNAENNNSIDIQYIQNTSRIHPKGEGVLQISSDGDDRRMFWGI